MAVQTANPGGVGNQTRDGLKQKLNFTNSSMEMPETKDAIYGAFGDILTLEEQEEEAKNPYTYNVYQQRAVQPTDVQNMQYTYGTAQQPVFRWLERIKTGTRTYNPADDFDNEMLDEYERMYNAGQAGDNALSPDEIMKQAGRDLVTGVASQAGASVGSALVDPFYANQNIVSKAASGLSNTFGLNPSDAASRLARGAGDLSPLGDDLVVLPSFATSSAAENVGRGNKIMFDQMFKENKLTNVGTVKNPVYAMSKAQQNLMNEASNTDAGIMDSDGLYQSVKTDPTQQITTGSQAIAEGSSYASGVTNRLDWSTTEGASNWSSSAGAAGTGFLVSLAMGAKPKQAAKQAVGSFAGRAIGTALLTPVLGPLAPIVGGAIGSMLAGRVICNELCKQGLIDKKQLLNDYKFTRDYLTPQHVNGYHVWAVWMVKQLRKKRFLSFWQHIVVHRGNEIAYIYGETNKPDYLGKLYRKIFEPVCWILGSFCKETDWSVLYQKKEI